MGLVVSSIVASTIGGAASAKFLHDSAPVVAWVAAAGLCAGLFAVARLFGRESPRPRRFVTLLALAILTFSFLMILGGESAPRPARRDTFGFILFIAEILGILAASVAVPSMLLAGALRRSNAEPRRTNSPLSPLLISFALAAAMFVAGFTLLAITMMASPAQWRLPAIALVGLGSPVVLLPLWTYMYQRWLSRWEVTPFPRSLSVGLENLRDRTGFAFARVLCLHPEFGGGAVCQVVSGLRGSTLIVSESIPSRLTADQLMAILAHEAAHVLLNHAGRKVAWGAAGGAVAIAMAVAAQLLISPWLPQSIGVAGVLVVIMPIAMLRGLYDTYVIRSHEAEADDFAVGVVGPPAFLSALETLGASGPSAAVVHTRWTTHGTWERRAARIREGNLRSE